MKPRKRKFSADGEILDLWRRLVDAELVKRRNALPEQVNQTLEKFVAMGNPESGGAYKCVRADCDSEIDTRVGIVLSSLKRTHQAVGSPPITEALAKKVKDEGGDYVEAIVKEVSEYMAHRLPMFKPAKQLFDFEDTKREVKKRIDLEMDLYFDSVGEAKKLAETGQDTKRMIGAIIISLLVVCIFELSVWFAPVTPFSWLKNHPNSYGLQGAIVFLVPCIFVGLLKRQYRKWCWGVGLVALLVLILSLLGGPPSGNVE
jgi:hypothetical protein